MNALVDSGEGMSAPTVGRGGFMGEGQGAIGRHLLAGLTSRNRMIYLLSRNVCGEKRMGC